MKTLLHYGRDTMDKELLEYIDKKWGQYEAALREKDSRLARHQHTMALIRTIAACIASIGFLLVAL
jgi:hypothetical protein